MTAPSPEPQQVAIASKGIGPSISARRLRSGRNLSLDPCLGDLPAVPSEIAEAETARESRNVG
jgi:hypothetical protein